MKWIDKFWSVSAGALDFSINLTADSLNTIGYLVCTVSGGAFAIASTMDESLTVSYYGSANATGKVDVGLRIPVFNYTLTKSIPFQQYLQNDDGLTYQLEEYIKPSTVRYVSVIATLVGTVLMLLGSNLKYWQKDKEELNYLKMKNSLEILPPNAMEYLSLSGESIARSFTIFMVSCSVVGAIFQFSGFIGSEHQLSYPIKGEGIVNSIHYKGPVKSVLIPFQFFVNQQEMAVLPVVQAEVLTEILVQAKAIVNATYGGDLIVSSNDNTNYPLVLTSTAVALTSYWACTFFAKKTTRQRDERVLATNKIGYDNGLNP